MPTLSALSCQLNELSRILPASILNNTQFQASAKAARDRLRLAGLDQPHDLAPSYVLDAFDNLDTAIGMAARSAAYTARLSKDARLAAYDSAATAAYNAQR